MVTLIGLSGSLRRGSYHSALLRAAAAMMSPQSELRTESITGIPLYDGDAERADGVPEPVTRLKDAIAGASPGGFGTVLSQNAWLPVFRTLGADFWSGGRLLVSRAGSVIDAYGEIVDAGTREKLGKFVSGFIAYVQQRKAKRT